MDAQQLDAETGLVLLDWEKEKKSHRLYSVLRRGQDILFGGLGLLILSPLMLLTAIAIFVDDPHGSPFFTQTRCGRDGKPFTMVKFRSMFMDAEQKLEGLMKLNEADGPAFKIKDDPRITRVGRFIRKVSIDELPQLWNILVGDMSIVGPRPALPREVEQYKPAWKQRMYVSPGLTCYWQISPHRNDISFDEWMKLDLKYIIERSFVVDWKIILKTLATIARREGE